MPFIKEYNFSKGKKKVENIKYKITSAESKDSTLCIINDSEIIRIGLYSLLNGLPHLKRADNFSKSDFLSEAQNGDYNLIITEIEFGNNIDVEFLKLLKNRYPAAKIIVYTNFKNSRYRNFAIHAGTDFYLYMEDRYNLLEHLVTGILNQIRYKSFK